MPVTVAEFDNCFQRVIDSSISNGRPGYKDEQRDGNFLRGKDFAEAKQGFSDHINTDENLPPDIESDLKAFIQKLEPPADTKIYFVGEDGKLKMDWDTSVQLDDYTAEEYKKFLDYLVDIYVAPEDEKTKKFHYYLCDVIAYLGITKARVEQEPDVLDSPPELNLDLGKKPQQEQRDGKAGDGEKSGQNVFENESGSRKPSLPKKINGALNEDREAMSFKDGHHKLFRDQLDVISAEGGVSDYVDWVIRFEKTNATTEEIPTMLQKQEILKEYVLECDENLKTFQIGLEQAAAADVEAAKRKYLVANEALVQVNEKVQKILIDLGKVGSSNSKDLQRDGDKVHKPEVVSESGEEAAGGDRKATDEKATIASGLLLVAGGLLVVAGAVSLASPVAATALPAGLIVTGTAALVGAIAVYASQPNNTIIPEKKSNTPPIANPTNHEGEPRT